MFRKILIANRGEIACRVIKTAKRLGIRSVAVYSQADRGARHVSLADEAYLLGPAPSEESYLRGDCLIDIAKRTGAQAIHPGYGFLSENADFAEKVAAARLTFVGPPPDAIRSMGEKDAAKRLMEKAGVPVVPGYHGEAQNDEVLAQEADKIGYPVLIKAVAGGGGKGMRRVDEPGGFSGALAGARREAAASFGDDRVLIEKYLEKPRHIEFQIFADAHGNCVHLFERDCSLQRRQQKVIEEAPAPGMTDTLREKMGKAAVSAAKAIGYAGAGTVEFIADTKRGLDAEQFYFIEMNTRLQVEHPVTEMITGLDLVEWQLRVAAGETLPLDQRGLGMNGHAVEARVYAEDPEREFMPATGVVTHLRIPAEGEGVRIDLGLEEGEAVTPYYDPMVAKVIAWAPERATALARLGAALETFELEGCITNVSFLRALVGHPECLDAAVDTGFIARHLDDLSAKAPAQKEALVIAALHQLLPEKTAVRRADPFSPWARCHGWRLWGGARQFLHISSAEDLHEVAATFRPDGSIGLELQGWHCRVASFRREGSRVRVDLGERILTGGVIGEAGKVTVFLKGAAYRFGLPDQLAGEAESASPDDRVVAPLPGKVSAVKVAVGDKLRAGQPLVLLEAMKMEHTLVAPRDGSVERIDCSEGELVEEGTALVLLGPVAEG